MSSEKANLSRRSFIASSAVAGTVGLAGTTTASADEIPSKFARVTPLMPAPQVEQGVSETTTPFAARLLNKAAYGPRQGEVAAFETLGDEFTTPLEAWLLEQLNPLADDPKVDNRVDPLTTPGLEYDTINKTALELWQDARSEDYNIRRRPVYQMERLTLLRATYSKWQLREVMYDFWFNHFNIYGREFPADSLMPEYDRQLRLNIFGNFEDMLLANARTSSMIYYLDNYANTWPRPNENYAREVMELHTLGAVENYYGTIDPGEVGNNSKGERAGYTEIDVFQLAKALTGWGVSDGRSEAPDTGEFLFRDFQHYNFSEGPIEVLDVTINQAVEGDPPNDETDVTTILSYLARHYGTARYIAWKMCVRLISDDPAETIVESTADVFYANRDDPEQLKLVYRHIIESDDFQNSWGEKVKRPVETVVHAMRGAGVDFTMRIGHGPSNNIVYRLDDTSHYPFYYSAPTGYPDERALWMGSGPLISSWRTVTKMLREFEIVNLAEQTNLAIPLWQDRTAENIVDTWMDRALGYALPTEQATKIVEFIQEITSISGDPLWEDVSNNTTQYSAYQKLIMAVVGLVLMSPDAMRR